MRPPARVRPRPDPLRALDHPAVVVALLTPFGRDGRLDAAALRDHVEHLVEERVDGLMPCGTTGEGPLLSEGEVAAVVATVVDASRGRVPVLAHVGRADTPATVRLARRALADGADGLSAVVPYYYALDGAQIVAHFRALIEAADGKPVYAYTIPARTGNELSVDAARSLGRDGLRGVKDSTKSFERHRQYLETGLDVLMGSDGMVARALAAGAAGCVSALANVRPDLLRRLKEAAAAGRDDDASAAQDELSALRAELSHGPPLVGLKRAASERFPGYRSTLRAPLG
ncbi:MAG TPA: dihydrodipicolinate synthase family protein [Gaiellaceae bacterium]|nr:dihydrodipicolinate synthase family protein [Gaiellaceae bacterium]